MEKVISTISARTLAQMDEAMRQMASGSVGDEFNLTEVEDLANEDERGGE